MREQLESGLRTSGQPVRRGSIAHEHDTYALLTDAAVQQRDADALAQYLPHMRELALRDGHCLYLAIAQRAGAVADRLAGAYESAAAQLQTAAESFERMGMRWQLARTLSEKAELAAVRSQADECRAFYAQALSLFEQLGAAPAAKQVRARLDDL